MPTSTGTIVMIVPRQREPASHWHQEPPDIDQYTRCLSAAGSVEACAGTSAESWTVTRGGALKSGGRCLAAGNGTVDMQACSAGEAQHWKYTLVGNLVGAGGQCLTAGGDYSQSQALSLQACGHNQPSQIWSLPN